MTADALFQTVGIVGYGRFGKLLAHALCDDFIVRVFDANAAAFSDESQIQPAPLSDVAGSDAVFFAVPISAFECALRRAAPHFKQGTLVMDVCSVKLHPEHVMRHNLPSGVYGLPLHPMFGPDSAKNGWRDLPLVFCPFADDSEAYQRRVAFWREYFSGRKGCRIVEMTPEAHDRITAHSLCLTQLLGRALGNMRIAPSEIDAASFKHLLTMKTISYNDSIELLLDLHRFNPFAKAMRKQLRDELARLERLIEER